MSKLGLECGQREAELFVGLERSGIPLFVWGAVGLHPTAGSSCFWFGCVPEK